MSCAAWIAIDKSLINLYLLVKFESLASLNSFFRLKMIKQIKQYSRKFRSV